MVLLDFASADPPDWEYTPGEWEFTSWLVGGIVQSDGNNIAEEGDLFAAFDNAGNIRGLAVQNSPLFGPYKGQIIYEMTMGSNADGDILNFQYYDVEQDAVLSIAEIYSFTANEQQGSLVNPIFYTIENMDINNNLWPQNYTLEQNYPNPYNPRTAINYAVSTLSNVTLIIYDIKGQLITELLHKIHTPGKYETIWDSSHLPTGMYLLEMKVYSIHDQLIFQAINKMLYLK